MWYTFAVSNAKKEILVKVVISNCRIIKIENRKVFFKCKKPKSNRWRTMSLDVMKFIRPIMCPASGVPGYAQFGGNMQGATAGKVQ